PAVARGVADGLGEVDGDEADARLDQPPGQETGLAVGRAAILVSDAVGFFAEVEGAAQPLRSEHAEGALVEGVDAAGGGGRLQGIGLSVEAAQQGAALIEPAEAETAGESQLGEAEAGAVGVVTEEQRIVVLAQKAGVLAGSDAAIAQLVRV